MGSMDDTDHHHERGCVRIGCRRADFPLSRGHCGVAICVLVHLRARGKFIDPLRLYSNLHLMQSMR